MADDKLSTACEAHFYGRVGTYIGPVRRWLNTAPGVIYNYKRESDAMALSC